MSITPRLLFLCMAISGATVLLIDRQQRQMTFSTLSTRGAMALQEVQLEQEPWPLNALSLDSHETRPPLSSLIGGNATDIKANVQFLLDFAIVGHPKTATTFTLGWLDSHREVQVYNYELHSLQRGNPAELVRQLYALPEGSQYKRGYKAPRDIMNPKVLRAFSKHWPKTKLLVGVRHPVRWLESFYNFRVRLGVAMPPAETLIGNCIPESHGVCTDGAAFHVHLSYLGKTAVSSHDEKGLLKVPFQKLTDLPRLPNKVFLYELTQLKDSNSTRADLYRSDLQSYLGLEHPLSPIDESEARQNKVNVLHICEDKYKDLRAELMRHSQAASLWIRKYFLPHPDVTVSSPEHFQELLKTWMTDPCLENKKM